MRKQDIQTNPKNPRIKELIDDEAEEQEARIKRIEEEFRKGFDFLKKYNKAATVFGSARCHLGDDIYEKTERLARGLAEEGFTVITGGGPGVMEAANKGAAEAGGKSVGINIELSGAHHTERRNEYVQEGESFHYFFSRKVMLAYASQVYFYMPGGFGTLDELFEIITLIQTGKIVPVPIILIHKEYWQPLLDWIRKELYENSKAINEEDMDIFELVDTPEEALELAKKFSDRFGNGVLYDCGKCKNLYDKESLANKCELWCEQNKEANPDIAKHSVDSQS